MKIPSYQQPQYLNPRKGYERSNSRLVIVTATIFAFYLLCAIFFILPPTMMLNSSTPIESKGTVVSHNPHIIRGTKSLSRDVYLDGILHQGDILCSCDMEYKSSESTVQVKQQIDLIMTEDGHIEMKDAVMEARNHSLWIIAGFLLPALFFMSFSIRHKSMELKNGNYSDARALSLMPGKFTPDDWKETFPDLADILNPETGNIDHNYDPPENESYNEKEKRFSDVIEKYRFPAKRVKDKK